MPVVAAPGPVIMQELDILQERTAIARKQASRFGVSNPQEYEKWIRWWAQWFIPLDSQQKEDMAKDMKEENDLSAWRPQGDWR